MSSTEVLRVTGPTQLNGAVKVSGAKNAALPLIIASLLTAGECSISNVPAIKDIGLLLSLLERLGARFSVEPHHELGVTVKISTPSIISAHAPYSLVKSIRASFWTLAPLLARGGEARVALPGGDIIGARPVDLHIAALEQMGAEIEIKHGVVVAAAPGGLKPADLTLRFPSVGATHQILMAAALTRGRTTLRGAAREPEVVALGEMLVGMGAQIDGLGTSDLEIIGKPELSGADVRVIGDRIEAGTFLFAAAVSRGRIKLDGVVPGFLTSPLEVLSAMGCAVTTERESVSLDASDGIRGVNVVTDPYPEFATDLQAPLMAALTLADGVSTIEERVFEGRFGHVAELCRMGARIAISDRVATITGVEALSGAPVEAHDIRAGAALLIAAIAAQGESDIYEMHHLRRGYEKLEQKFLALGANLEVRHVDGEGVSSVGC